MTNKRRAELRRWLAQGGASISHYDAAMVRECLNALDAVAEFARTLDPETPNNDPLETIKGAHILNRNAIRLQRERAEKAEGRLEEKRGLMCDALGILRDASWIRLTLVGEDVRGRAETAERVNGENAAQFTSIMADAVADTALLKEYGRELFIEREGRIDRLEAFSAAQGRVNERALELAKDEQAPSEHPDTTMLRELTEAVHDVVSEGFGLQRLETPLLAAQKRLKL